jgi:hypothetical protein
MNAPVFALSATMVAARPDELVTAARTVSLMDHLHYLPNRRPVIGRPSLCLPAARPHSLPMEDD